MSSAPACASPGLSSGTLFSSASFFGVRIAALVEMLVFYSVMLLWDTILGEGNRFMDLTPHPFWVVILLVILQYGIGEAIAAAAVASIFLLAGNMPLQSLNETMYDYAARVGLLPFLWMTAALVLGGIRTRQLQERERLWQKLDLAEQEKSRLAESYRAIKQAKEKLELRLVEEYRSVAMVYEAAKTLEAADSSNRLEAASRLVRVALNPKKFSLYRVENNALVLESASGWEHPGAYLARFEEDSPLAQAILKGQQTLSVIHAEDEQTLENQGLLAGPILNPATGEVFGMLKIEDMGFMDMGIRTHKTFHVVCEWLARTYAGAASLPKAKDKKVLSMSSVRTKKKLSVEERSHAAL